MFLAAGTMGGTVGAVSLDCGKPGFYLGVSVCPVPEGDWEDGQGHPGHVPREGHPGSVSERGLCLHRSPSDGS